MNAALKWKLAVACLLVFVAGVMTGGLLCAHHMHRFLLGPPHSAEMAGKMREHLRRALDLTPEQATTIMPIIDATATKLEAIRMESAQRVRNTMEEAHRAMAPQLTPEQQNKLRALEEKHRHALMHHGFLSSPHDQPSP